MFIWIFRNMIFQQISILNIEVSVSKRLKNKKGHTVQPTYNKLPLSARIFKSECDLFLAIITCTNQIPDTCNWQCTAINKATSQYKRLIKQLTCLLTWMLHNTRCVSVIDHINEKRFTLLSTHNAAQCITIPAKSTVEFHGPV